jgi:hypothetical protein
MIESARREVVIISIHNDYLKRYAKNLAAASEKRSVTVVILEGTRDLIGLLGKARLLCVNKGKFSPPEPFISNAMETSDKRLEYDVEMIMVCDREVSVILSKEMSGHRAIISSGTVVDYFINRMMDMTIMEARECD